MQGTIEEGELRPHEVSSIWPRTVDTRIRMARSIYRRVCGKARYFHYYLQKVIAGQPDDQPSHNKGAAKTRSDLPHAEAMRLRDLLELNSPAKAGSPGIPGRDTTWWAPPPPRPERCDAEALLWPDWCPAIAAYSICRGAVLRRDRSKRVLSGKSR
jgi:hypothetical protein